MGYTLKEYIAELQKVVDKYPDAKAVYSHDDEGNQHQLVSWAGTPGYYDDNGEFFQESDFKYCREEMGMEPVINAVCIN